MSNEIRIVFPEFITHARISKNKYKKIGYNVIHSSSHFTLRDAFVRSMHNYIEHFMPQGVHIDGPVETEVLIYAPINYGNVRMIKDKVTNAHKLSWNSPKEGYAPNWDIFNLGAVWLKSLDDAAIKAGWLPDDNVQHFRGFSGKFIEVDKLEDRKIVYVMKNINYANNQNLLDKIKLKHEFYTKLRNKLYRLSNKDNEITEWVEKVEKKLLVFENQIINLDSWEKQTTEI